MKVLVLLLGFVYLTTGHAGIRPVANIFQADSLDDTHKPIQPQAVAQPNIFQTDHHYGLPDDVDLPHISQKQPITPITLAVNAVIHQKNDHHYDVPTILAGPQKPNTAFVTNPVVHAEGPIPNVATHYESYAGEPDYYYIHKGMSMPFLTIANCLLCIRYWPN